MYLPVVEKFRTVDISCSYKTSHTLNIDEPFIHLQNTENSARTSRKEKTTQF